MNWTDTFAIAEQLADDYPDVDPLTVSFPWLMKTVLGFPGFLGQENRCGEKILEAIQQAWIDEVAE